VNFRSPVESLNGCLRYRDADAGMEPWESPLPPPPPPPLDGVGGGVGTGLVDAVDTPVIARELGPGKGPDEACDGEDMVVWFYKMGFPQCLVTPSSGRRGDKWYSGDDVGIIVAF